MKLNKNESEIFESLTELPVIDAHEHLMPEKHRVSMKLDFFLLFSHYTKADLLSAGMMLQDYERLMKDQDMPVEKKWEVFHPFYPLIRYGSYARPALIWLREVLGYDDLTEKNYREISAKLQEWNKPGLYHRILRDMCRIETALVVSANYQEYDFDLLKPLWSLMDYTTEGSMRKFFRGDSGKNARHIEDYLDWMEADFRRYMDMGGIGIKLWCLPLEKPDIEKGNRIFKRLQGGDKNAGISPTETLLLTSVIYDRAFRLARENDITVAVHSGVWGDFRNSQPAHLIPIATNYPNVSFDLFHLGMPFVREAVMIGKMFPNVSLNLCWLSLASPEQTFRMLDECVDLVPMNNIIAFGGDYGLPVEKVYGHLKMAREVVARVLSKRIDREQMDFAEAFRIAKMWFYDNPVEIYDLRSGVHRGKDSREKGSN